MYAYTCLYLHVYVCVYTYIHIFVCTYIRTVCVSTYMFIHICIYVCTYIRTHIHTLYLNIVLNLHCLSNLKWHLFCKTRCQVSVSCSQGYGRHCFFVLFFISIFKHKVRPGHNLNCVISLRWREVIMNINMYSWLFFKLWLCCLWCPVERVSEQCTINGGEQSQRKYQVFFHCCLPRSAVRLI